MDPQQRYVEIWGDRVSLPHLLLALGLVLAAIVLGVVVAAAISIDPFFPGLGGAVIGFLVATVVIRPKRHVEIHDENGDAPVAEER